MDKTDLDTIKIVDERYGVINVVGRFITYIQESNKELVELKRAVESFVGHDVSPRTPEQLQKLREGGDMLRGIQKVLEINRKIKGK